MNKKFLMQLLLLVLVAALFVGVVTLAVAKLGDHMRQQDAYQSNVANQEKWLRDELVRMVNGIRFFEDPRTNTIYRVYCTTFVGCNPNTIVEVQNNYGLAGDNEVFRLKYDEVVRLIPGIDNRGGW